MAKYFIRFVGHVIQQPGIAMPHEIYYDVISDFDQEDLEPVKKPDGTVTIGPQAILQHGNVRVDGARHDRSEISEQDARRH